MNLMSLNLVKTRELVIKTKTSKPPHKPMSGVKQVLSLKLLSVTFQDSPTNWDLQFDNLMQNSLKRVHILQVCKVSGYCIQDLQYLFNVVIMSHFT